MVVFNRLDTNSGGDMSFTRSGSTNQNDVVCIIEKVTAMQLLDQCLVYLTACEVKAVRIALTSGLTRREVASDLGVGLSTLSKWIQRSRPADMPPASDIDLAKENERLRKENRLLLEEREVLN